MGFSDLAYIRRFFSVFSQEEKDKVRGHAFYPSDYLSALLPEGVAHLYVLRSPHHGGRFSKIDVSEAEKQPGVLKVITAEHIPSNIPMAGGAKESQLVLPRSEVRFKGEPVALIVAEDAAKARAAEAFVKIDWEPLAERAPEVFETLEYSKGIAASSAQSKSVETSFRFPSLHARYLEPESGWVSLTDEKLTFHIGSLLSEAQRIWLADLLQIPVSSILAQEAYLGGQFGGRQQREMIAFLALGSWLCKRSCAMALSYQDQDVGSYGYSGQLRISYDPQSGRLQELRGELRIDSGSYEGNAAKVLRTCLEHAAGVYQFDHVQLKGEVIRTASHPRRALKGEGITAITWVTEQLIDQIAKELDLPALDFRASQIGESDSIRRVVEETESLERPFRLLTIDRNKPLWDLKRIEGRGFSFQTYQSSRESSMDELEVSVELQVSGSFVIRTSNHTLDLHMKTALSDVAASVLKTHPKAFTVVGEMRERFDSPRKRETYPEFYYLAQATWHAADALREKILKQAEDYFRSSSLEIKDGAVQDQKTNKKVGFRELAFTTGAQDLKSSYVLKDFDRPHGCSAGAVSRVSFDPLTGELSVDSVKVVVDAGPVVRRSGLEIEVETAVSWALAALFSSSVERNQPIPTSLDGPDAVTLVPLEYSLSTYSDRPPDYFGSRGVSDVLMAVVLASLATALQDAKDQTLKEIPMVPEFMYPKEIPQRANMIPFRRP